MEKIKMKMNLVRFEKRFWVISYFNIVVKEILIVYKRGLMVRKN